MKKYTFFICLVLLCIPAFASLVVDLGDEVPSSSGASVAQSAFINNDLDRTRHWYATFQTPVGSIVHLPNKVMVGDLFSAETICIHRNILNGKELKSTLVLSVQFSYEEFEQRLRTAGLID